MPHLWGFQFQLQLYQRQNQPHISSPYPLPPWSGWKTLEFLISHKQPGKCFLQDITCSLLSIYPLILSVFAVALAFPSFPYNPWSNWFQACLTNALPSSCWCLVSSHSWKITKWCHQLFALKGLSEFIWRVGALLSVSSGKVCNTGIWRLIQSSGGLSSEV